ncbi:MAG: hypothetical protein QF864_07205 [SAR202 cluster bacterium]|jgi:hypothetical protein|nr:hypothetical protein [SAR202 cluster bacterium]|tara:strand:- start:124 stop:1014 length:891 start_codon:yes stop_codon:yes gene_type:complete
MSRFKSKSNKIKKTDSEPFSSNKNIKKYLNKFENKIFQRLDNNEINIKKEFEKVFSPDSLSKTFQGLFEEKTNKIDELKRKIEEKDIQHLEAINGQIQEKEKAVRVTENHFKKFTEEKEKTIVLGEKLEDATSQLEELNLINKKHDNETDQIKKFISDDNNFLNAINKDLKLFNTVKTISNILNELNDCLKLRDLQSSREVITADYEKNITLCISSLLVNYGLKTEGFDQLLIGVNKRIPTYLIEYTDKEGSPMNANEHVATDSSKNTFIEKYHTLPIKNKELNNSLTFKAIIDAK